MANMADSVEADPSLVSDLRPLRRPGSASTLSAMLASLRMLAIAIHSVTDPRPPWPRLPKLNSTQTLGHPYTRWNLSAESAGGGEVIDK